ELHGRPAPAAVRGRLPARLLRAERLQPGLQAVDRLDPGVVAPAAGVRGAPRPPPGTSPHLPGPPPLPSAPGATSRPGRPTPIRFRPAFFPRPVPGWPGARLDAASTSALPPWQAHGELLPPSCLTTSRAGTCGSDRSSSSTTPVTATVLKRYFSS